MGQRLSDSAVSHKYDKQYWKTPLGFKKNGQPFYPIGGASPDDDSNDDGGTGGTGEGSDSGSEGQNGGDKEGAGSKDSGGDTIPKADFDALMERMKAADRNKSAVEAQLKELQEKDLSEQEKLAKRLPELEQSVTQLTEENVQLKAKVAFLGNTEHSWHDSDVALSQVDLSEVTKDDGTIDKAVLKKAVEKLAKDKPYLVKSSQDDSKSGGSGTGGNGGSGQGSSGTPVGGGSNNGNKNGLDEAALRKKYPALN